MGNQFYVKHTFDSYFDRLKNMAEILEELKHLAVNVSEPNLNHNINRLVCDLERDMTQYAVKLRTGGTEILKRVA